ncbi:MAG: CFI-box-CTERM domain-containing protein [Nitrospirota bacterium]
MALMCSSRSASALDLIVEHNPTDPSHFSTIQSALTYVTQQTPTTTSFKIIVEPSETPYTGPIIPVSNVPISGRETARTLLTGSANGTIVTLSNIANVTISHFTFYGASVGIDVLSNSSTINLNNNVFTMGGSSGTGVRVAAPAGVSIINNTFYQNLTAIDTNADILITNNIFSGNGTAVSSSVPLTQASYNDYHNNTSNGNVILDLNSLPNVSVPSPADPLFVAPASRDFHLLASSPCHSYNGGSTQAGNPNYPNAVDSSSFDMGAYGGLSADTVPVPVQSVAASGSTSTAPPFSISVSWANDLSYQVKGYKVYYGYASGSYNGNDAVVSGLTGTSPIDAGNVNPFTLDRLNPSVATPAAPYVYPPQPRNETLNLSWTSVGATRYDVYYALASAPSLTIGPLNAGSATSYTLTGLVNGETYNVAVKAISQATYYIVVTSYTSTNPSQQNRGIAFESAYSAQVSANLGDPLQSPLSNVVTGIPEPITSLPDLPNTGCFIATAAYGSPLAPSVQALREFRDRFLVTNTPGRAFVRWYYTNGPAAARYLNEHPAVKPLAQAALTPLVAAALFFTRTSPVFQTAVLLALAFLAAALLRRIRARMPSKETSR